MKSPIVTVQFNHEKPVLAESLGVSRERESELMATFLKKLKELESEGADNMGMISPSQAIEIATRVATTYEEAIISLHHVSTAIVYAYLYNKTIPEIIVESDVCNPKAGEDAG